MNPREHLVFLRSSGDSTLLNRTADVQRCEYDRRSGKLWVKFSNYFDYYSYNKRNALWLQNPKMVDDPQELVQLFGDNAPESISAAYIFGDMYVCVYYNNWEHHVFPMKKGKPKLNRDCTNYINYVPRTSYWKFKIALLLLWASVALLYITVNDIEVDIIIRAVAAIIVLIFLFS